MGMSCILFNFGEQGLYGFLPPGFYELHEPVLGIKQQTGYPFGAIASVGIHQNVEQQLVGDFNGGVTGKDQLEAGHGEASLLAKRLEQLPRLHFQSGCDFLDGFQAGFAFPTLQHGDIGSIQARDAG